MKLFRRGRGNDYAKTVPEPVPWTWLNAKQLDERFGPTLSGVKRDWIVDGMHFSGTLSQACDRAASHCRRMREVAPWYRSSVALAKPGQFAEVVFV